MSIVLKFATLIAKNVKCRKFLILGTSLTESIFKQLPYLPWSSVAVGWKLWKEYRFENHTSEILQCATKDPKLISTNLIETAEPSTTSTYERKWVFVMNLVCTSKRDVVWNPGVYVEKKKKA